MIGRIRIYPVSAGFSSHAAVGEFENTNGTVAIVTFSTFTSEKLDALFSIMAQVYQLQHRLCKGLMETV